MRRVWLLLLAVAALCGVGAITPAEAACHQNSVCICTVSASGVNFGNYNPVDPTNLDSAGAIEVYCTQSQPRPLSFDINLSTGGSGSYAVRTMTGPGSQLQYNLYHDAARAMIWGNGTGGSTDVTLSYNGQRIVDETVSVYGRVFSGQSPPPGAYADTIIVTVVY